MARRRVTAQIRSSAQGQSLRSTATKARGSLRPQSRRASWRWWARRAGECSVAVLAAAAPAGGRELRPAGRAEKVRPAEGDRSCDGGVS